MMIFEEGAINFHSIKIYFHQLQEVYNWTKKLIMVIELSGGQFGLKSQV